VTASGGALAVVGTGIRFEAHLTAQATKYMERAECILYAVADPATRSMLKARFGERAESLEGYYSTERRRKETYELMARHTLDAVRAGKHVCLVLYGHPGVFATFGHTVVARARAEGYPALMFPGVSAEDCLFADLGFDPAERGCQSFEATDFILRPRTVDPSVGLVLFQITSIGENRLPMKLGRNSLALLVQVLSEQYPADHEVVIYQAAVYAVTPPFISRVALRELPNAAMPPMATLYIPPHGKRRLDKAMRERLRAAARADYGDGVVAEPVTVTVSA
jgi:uncharacterized protein YabN with tetrapyrrole methylase and pyrophosphatase domain